MWYHIRGGLNMNLKIKVKNLELKPYVQFLQSLELKGKASRGRSKIAKALDERNMEYIKDVESIQKEYFKTDENGKLLADKQGKLTPKDETSTEKAQKSMDELQNESSVVDLSSYPEQVEAFVKEMDNYDKEFSNAEATTYDEIMSKFEEE